MPVAKTTHTPPPIRPAIPSAKGSRPYGVAAILREACQNALTAVSAMAELAAANENFAHSPANRLAAPAFGEIPGDRTDLPI